MARQPTESLTSADATWLIENANATLAELESASPLQRAKVCRSRHGHERGRLLCELADLRQRAKSKFTRAEAMFFTRRSLEQATDERISSYKARRFAGSDEIFDLCSGIGGDTLGLATTTSSSLRLVDKNPGLCEFAAANLTAYGVAGNRVRTDCGNALDVRLDTCGAWHIDPDRRADGDRHAKVDDCQPSWPDILRLVDKSPNGAIKLAPTASVNQLLERGVELEWIGHRRECQQLMAWSGELARYPGCRVCTVLTNEGSVSFQGQSAPAPSVAENEQRYVFEPESPVLAAGLTNCLAEHYNLQRLAPNVVYLTGNKLVESDLVSTFEVIAALPFRKKAIQRLLRSQDLKLREVKRRMVRQDPSTLLHEFSGEGSTPVVLLLYPRQRSVRAILAKRV